MSKKPILIFGTLIFVAFFSVVAFYARYEIVVNHLRNDLGYNGATANAVKHAYAAAELYGVFSTVLPQHFAEKTVLGFGLINEYVERVTKFHKPDSQEEVMKDLYNNLAGITLKQWLKDHSTKRSTLDILIKMADERILIVSRKQNPFYDDKGLDGGNVVEKADKWLVSYKEQAQSRLRQRLDHIVTTSNP